MSCWCDGGDPGCELCRPSLDDRQRVAVRAVSALQAKLLQLAASETALAEDFVETAWRYRLALAEEKDSFAPYRPTKFDLK
jgi:hypothetical protein